MVANRQNTRRAVSLPAGVAIGASSGLIWTVIASMLLAKLIDGETLPEEVIGYGSMVILLTASLVGSLIAYWKVKRQRALVCAVTGVVYYLLLLSMTALFFGGQYNAIGVTALVILAGCGTSILMGLGKRRGNSQRAYKIRT